MVAISQKMYGKMFLFCCTLGIFLSIANILQNPHWSIIIFNLLILCLHLYMLFTRRKAIKTLFNSKKTIV